MAIFIMQMKATAGDGFRYAYNVFVSADNLDNAIGIGLSKLESQGCTHVECARTKEFADDALSHVDGALADAIIDAQAGKVGVIQYTTPIDQPN